MHPDIYKRPLLLTLILLIAGLFLFYKPVPSARDVRHFLPQKEVSLIGRVERFYTPKPKTNNIIIKVILVDGQPTSGYVYARLKNFEPQWKDTLQITGRLQEPYGVDLLGNFNWKRYLSYQHVFTEIKSKEVTLLKPAAWPYRALRSIRADILRTFSQNFPPDLANIAGGILLGERGELDPQLYSAFQDSGAIHLLVASGGNVGFVTLITLAVCGLLRIPRKKALWLALAVAGMYTFIAGGDAPLIRAYFMAVCACVGYYLGRNSGVFQGLLLSGFVILIFAPASLFETGFQMSFLATAALIICLTNYPVPAKWPGWVRFFAQIFLATLSVQLVLLPVFTNVFYKISLTGLIANMLLVPLASLLLGLSFAYYVFSALHIGIVLFYPTHFCLEIFKYLVEFFASFRFSAIPATAWGAGTITAYYALLFLALNLPCRKLAKKLIIPICAVAAGALLFQYFVNQSTHIYILDEWHKNTVFIQTADGNIFVVGPQLSPDKIQNALYKLGCRQATAVFLTENQPSGYPYTSLSSQVVRPFENTWPDENAWKFKQTSVRLIWGLHETQAGRIWQNIGYSGSKQDDVSYCFTVKQSPEFCVGAQARFVRTPIKVIDPVLNQTVREKL